MVRDRFKYFRVEARDLHDQLTRNLLALDRGDAEPGRIAEILRLAHTLKGAARVVGATSIAQAAHGLEDILAPGRKEPGQLRRAHISDALRLLDAVSADLAALDSPGPSPGEGGQASDSPRAAGTVPGRTNPTAPEESFASVRVEMADLDRLVEGVAEAVRRQEGLRRCLETLVLPGPASEGLQDKLDELRREIDGVRELAGEIRLVPVSAMLAKLERATLDVAESLGKRVAFEATGGEVRIDAHVLQALSDAFVQIVRNAVAHGIEAPAERAAAGKSREGRISVSVSRSAGRVSVSCQDDGRGIDGAAVRRAAASSGKAGRDLVEVADIGQLLLTGGITTARNVTEVAGRGVGLDVVRAIADRLGGTAAFETWAGQGTRFDLTAPVSLASLTGLVVAAGDRTAAIPLDAIREVLRQAAADSRHSSGNPMFAWHDRHIPLIRLDQLVGGSSARDLVWAARTVVCVESAGRFAAVAVDRLVARTDLLVRRLPAASGPCPLFSGAYFDEEGIPRPVLDPEGIVTAAGSASRDPEIPAAVSDGARVLVIDDSLTTRMLEQSILDSAGFEVDVAVSGEDALERAVPGTYALFIVDVEMPGMTGFEFVERIRRDPGLHDTPCVIVTSLAEERHRRRSVEVGAQAYIVKSDFHQDAFLSIVQELARRP